MPLKSINQSTHMYAILNLIIFNNSCCHLLSLTLFRINPEVCGVMVIVVGNGHGDTSSNPERD